MKKKCGCVGCKKDAVIIENKEYYCGPCYINKFIGVYKRLQFKPVDNRYESTNKGKL